MSTCPESDHTSTEKPTMDLQQIRQRVIDWGPYDTLGQAVAVEMTFREQHGLSGYHSELDGAIWPEPMSIYWAVHPNGRPHGERGQATDAERISAQREEPVMGDTPRKPFEFPPDVVTREGAVFTALGAATVCWESMAGTGLFDEARASEIGNALLAKLTELTPLQVNTTSVDFGDEVRAERATHAQHGYTDHHDSEHGLSHLVYEAVTYAAASESQPDDGSTRRQLVKAASVLWAAADLSEREGYLKGGSDG